MTDKEFDAWDKKCEAYNDVKSGDDLWFLEVLTTLQVEGKLSFAELGFIMHSVIY